LLVMMLMKIVEESGTHASVLVPDTAAGDQNEEK